MQRFSMLTICLLAVASFMAMPAWAQTSGAHYQHGSVSAAIQSNGDLLVSWVEAGLGNLDVDYSLTAGDAAATPPIVGVKATYFCVTNSGGIPNANNKHTLNTTVSTEGTLKPKNGKVIGALPLPAPPAPVSAPPTCGNGQTLALQSIAWFDVVLTDTSNGVTTDVTKGTFSITLFPAPK